MSEGLISNELERKQLAAWLKEALAGIRKEAAAKAARGVSSPGEYSAIVTLINVSLVTLGRSEP